MPVVLRCWHHSVVTGGLIPKSISCKESRDDFSEAWNTQAHFNHFISNYDRVVLLPFHLGTCGHILLEPKDLGHTLRMLPVLSHSCLHITINILDQIQEGKKQISGLPFMLLQLFPLLPQQDDGDELFATAKELQFLRLCASGSEHWDLLTVLLRVPESSNSSKWTCQTQLLKNIIKLANGNPSPPLPVVSYIHVLFHSCQAQKNPSLQPHLIQCQFSSAISRVINQVLIKLCLHCLLRKHRCVC